MAKHLSPHDRVLRSTMSQPQVIKEFFNNYLPVNIKKEIDIDSIQLQKDSFIDDKLRMQITDLLYTAQFGKQQGYLYILVEHQSTPDKLMPYRILKYKLSIMDHHLKTTGDKQLPVIYPLIFYSGKRTYNHSTNIFDLFGNQKQLAEDILYRPYQLIDLKQIPDNKLKAQLWFGVLGRIMKHIYSKDVLPYFRGIMPELKIIENYGNNDYTYIIISYLFEVGEVPDKNEFIKTVKTGLSVDEEKVMTLAEQFKAEGKAEGRVEGEITALRKMALKMLNEGLDSKKVAKLTEISEKNLYELLAKAKKREK
jgi:predicted transposase/invertase (TIGR01784 family)